MGKILSCQNSARRQCPRARGPGRKLEGQEHQDDKLLAGLVVFAVIPVFKAEEEGSRMVA